MRAELAGIGTADAKGLGRLSREMGMANTRLAGSACRAGIAMSAAAAAATASLGLIVRSTAESAAQIRQIAQVANATPEALQRWSAGARTVGIAQLRRLVLSNMLLGLRYQNVRQMEVRGQGQRQDM